MDMILYFTSNYCVQKLTHQEGCLAAVCLGWLLVPVGVGVGAIGKLSTLWYSFWGGHWQQTDLEDEGVETTGS